jgi:hypothetical protein
VRLAIGCTVRGCNLEGVSGFPIIGITGSDNVVDGNRTRLGTYGVQVSAGGGSNVIVRNTFLEPANGATVTMATDSVGPLVSTSGTISSTNPWANFLK